MQPHCLFVCRGGKTKERGVWAMERLEPGVWFGPIRGSVQPVDSADENRLEHTPAWEIRCDGNICCMISSSEQSETDWLHHVTSTYVSRTGTNMVAYQYGGQIYYVTTKVIRHGQELTLGLKSGKRNNIKVPEGISFQEMCSKCHHKHSTDPIKARRNDWSGHIKRHRVRINSYLPTLKLYPDAEVLMKQPPGEFQHNINRFRCFYCGWRFSTVARCASHQRNHLLRYLKFRLQAARIGSATDSREGATVYFTSSSEKEIDEASTTEYWVNTVESADRSTQSNKTIRAQQEAINSNYIPSFESVEVENSSALPRGVCTDSNEIISKQIKDKNDNENAPSGSVHSLPSQVDPQNIKRRSLRVRPKSPVVRQQPQMKCAAKVPKSKPAKTRCKGKQSNDHPCTLCDKSFSTQSNLKKHIRIHTGEKPYACTYCNKRFAEVTNLNTHTRIHTGHNPYECATCGKKFKYLKGFKLHVDQHGRGPVTYKCSVCDRQFNQKGPCRTHEKSHRRERPFKCDVCDMKFKREMGLRTHASKMHAPSCDDVTATTKRKKRGRPAKNKGAKTANGSPHECSYCGKEFKYNYALKQHMRIHTGERPFKCSECDAAFSQSSNLTSHRRIHTGETPYRCRHCEKRFTCAQNLRSHLRIHTGEKPYQCPDCPTRFAYSSYLKVHMLIHSDKKPYQCNICDKEFRHPTSFKIHNRRLHSAGSQKS